MRALKAAHLANGCKTYLLTCLAALLTLIKLSSFVSYICRLSCVAHNWQR